MGTPPPFRLVELNNSAVPPNMTVSSPERIYTALSALQRQARSASELIGHMREAKHSDRLDVISEAFERLEGSQSVIRTMPRECFVVIEAARLLGKPIPDVTVQDLVFTGLIALEIHAWPLFDNEMFRP